MTLDGGRTWQVRPAANTTSVGRRQDGRAVLLARSASEPADWEPSLQNIDAELDSSAAITVGILARLTALREGTVLSPGSSERVPLRHVAETSTVRWGAHEKQIFRSPPGGDWYLFAELDSPVAQLAVLEGGSYLAQTTSGLIKDGKPADAAAIMDWDRLTGDRRGVESLRCFEKGTSKLTLEWKASGCFGGTKGEVELFVSDKDGLVKARSEEAQRQFTLPLQEARALARRFAAAATQPEIPSGCFSTTHHFATLIWKCEGETSHALQFETSECGTTSVRYTGGETRSGVGAPQGFSRALELIELARSLQDASDAGR